MPERCPICDTELACGRWCHFCKRDMAYELSQQTIEMLNSAVRGWQNHCHELEMHIREATIDAMGGTPDLFSPDRGWDEWDEKAKRLLSAPELARPADEPATGKDDNHQKRTKNRLARGVEGKNQL